MDVRFVAPRIGCPCVAWGDNIRRVPELPFAGKKAHRAWQFLRNKWQMPEVYRPRGSWHSGRSSFRACAGAAFSSLPERLWTRPLAEAALLDCRLFDRHPRLNREVLARRARLADFAFVDSGLRFSEHRRRKIIDIGYEAHRSVRAVGPFF
jgi:hypothetical protein